MCARVLPEMVKDGVEGESIRPACGEVEHVHVTPATCAVSDPTQQRFLTVRLLQTGHHVLHDVFNLHTHHGGDNDACI